MNDIKTSLTPEQAQIHTLENQLARAYNAVRKLNDQTESLTQGFHSGLAMAAMQGFIAAIGDKAMGYDKQFIAKAAFNMADAMIGEYKQRNTPDESTQETINEANAYGVEDPALN